MWEVIAVGAFGVVSATIGFTGNFLAERSRGKLELAKQKAIATHELARQKASESHELRQSIRGELLDEIIDLLRKELADARRIASELQSLGNQLAGHKARLSIVAERRKELADKNSEGSSEYDSYSQQAQQLDRQIASTYAEMDEKLETFIDARNAFSDRATKARIVAPDDVAQIVEQIDHRLGLIIDRSFHGDEVEYNPTNLELIREVRQLKNQLIAVVRYWVHQ